jgi:hypothetical protein
MSEKSSEGYSLAHLMEDLVFQCQLIDDLREAGRKLEETLDFQWGEFPGMLAQ